MENSKYVQIYKFIENNRHLLTQKFLGNLTNKLIENNTYVLTDKFIKKQHKGTNK